jgi:hypothetical protein
MATIERIMVEEAFDNSTYRVLKTPLKDEVPYHIWQKVEKDDFSWWDVQKETELIFPERKLRKELRLSEDVPLLEGMVFIKISEGKAVKGIIPYTPQARAASKEVYGSVLKA